MDDNKKKNEYSTGYNSAFDFPDFDSLSRTPKKEPVKPSPVKIDATPISQPAEKPQPKTEPKAESAEAQENPTAKKSKAFAPICIALIAAIIVCNIFTVIGFADAATPSNTSTAESDGYNEFSSITPKFKATTYPSGIQKKLARVYAANNDVVGWLYIPGTNVNTPVLQGKTNESYLRSNFYGTNTNYGQAYADCKGSRTALNKNTIIYGHNMPAGTHFYDVNRFEDIEWYKSHPTITYSTLSGTYTYLIYTAFYSTVRAKADNGYVFNYIEPNMSDSSFAGFIDQVNQRALYTTAVDLKATDRIITLSTCNHTYDTLCGQRVDSRLVVIGRLLRSGESTDVDTSKAKSNPDYRKPQVYYDYKGKTNPYKNAVQWRP